MEDPAKVPETISPQPVSDRSIAAWEIVSVVCSLLIAEWVALALFGSGKLIVTTPVILAFRLMLDSHRCGRRLRASESIDNFRCHMKLAFYSTWS